MGHVPRRSGIGHRRRQVPACRPSLQSYVVFGNTKLLEAAGVALPTADAPWTWDDLANARS